MASSPLTKQQIREAWKLGYPRDTSFRTQASRLVTEFIFSTPEFRLAERVALYMPRAWEIDLTPLWHKSPTRCVFPKVEPTTLSLSFYRIESLSELTPGYARILEPPAIEARRVILWTSRDLILVPGYAYDRWGGRIGSGFGYYDRFLPPVSAQRWGVCFAQQISEERLAQEPTDARMDALVCESGVQKSR